MGVMIFISIFIAALVKLPVKVFIVLSVWLSLDT